MKKIKIILIILVLIWMSTIFYFSSQPGDESKTTSSTVTKTIAKIIYDETAENYLEKEQALDPIIRKLAHYTIYLIRRNNYNNIHTYIQTKKLANNTNKPSYTAQFMQ